MRNNDFMNMLNGTIKKYQEHYNKCLDDFDKAIAKVPSDQAKKYYEIKVELQKATRENDRKKLYSLLDKLKELNL